MQGQAFDDTYNGPKLALPEALRVEYGIGWKSKHPLISASQSFRIVITGIKFETQYQNSLWQGKDWKSQGDPFGSDAGGERHGGHNEPAIHCLYVFIVTQILTLCIVFQKFYFDDLFWKTVKSKLTETQRLAPAQRTKAR